jgi:DNA-binding transcriptional LysR family regulator
LATPRPKLGAIDLNLLVVFDAIMQDRSVTRAGKRVGLSQPAMSHALIRLRHMLKDELFVRSPKGMMPTPRAEQLALPVRSALDEFQHALAPAEFEAADAIQTFRIAVDNDTAILLVGALAARITKLAPQLTLDFRPSGTLDVPNALDRSEIDLAIGALTERGERFSRKLLLRDGFVVVLRKNHPAANPARLSVEAFAALPHLEVSSVSHETEFINRFLARRKLTRRIALRAPILSVVLILIGSDMVAVLPRRIAEELTRSRPLTIRPLPHPSPEIETAMIWARRLDNQPAHRWLRQIVEQAASGLGTVS